MVFSGLRMEIILCSRRNYNVKQIIMSVKGNVIWEIIMWKCKNCTSKISSVFASQTTRAIDSIT